MEVKTRNFRLTSISADWKPDFGLYDYRHRGRCAKVLFDDVDPNDALGRPNDDLQLLHSGEQVAFFQRRDLDDVIVEQLEHIAANGELKGPDKIEEP